MKVIEYSETIVWEDPVILLIEETVQYDEGGPPRCTYTVYMEGSRVITSISKEAVDLALNDMINALEFEEAYA